LTEEEIKIVEGGYDSPLLRGVKGGGKKNYPSP